MEVAKSSSQFRKYVKYSTKTAADTGKQGRILMHGMSCVITDGGRRKKRMRERRPRGVLTSHAIVGEPLTELIDNDEEDAERVPKHHFGLEKQESDISKWCEKKCVKLSSLHKNTSIHIYMYM